MDWKLNQRAEDAPENVVVETKIDDEENGPRNHALLKRKGNLWWTPDGEIYVYYRPTHWRFATPNQETDHG